MNIQYTDKQITFTFPRFAKRQNPYDEDGYYGQYPTFTGLIVRHRKYGSHYDELGFAGTIDMDYKDKPDQVSDFIVRWYDGEEEFKLWCEELDIDVHEMTV